MRFLLVLAASQAFAQPVNEAERRKVLQEMRTCMLAGDKQGAIGDTQFRRGAYAEAVHAYEASMGCPGTVPSPHEKAKVALAACRAGDAALAKKYYATLLHAHRRGLDAVCAKQKILLRAPSTPQRGLDQDMIAETLEPLVGVLEHCVMSNVPDPKRGFRVTVGGKAAASGAVTGVDVRGPWVACAERILRGVKFPATTAGGTFSYELFADPSLLNPAKAIAHAERWFAGGQHREAVRQWVWILGSATTPAHTQRAMEMACEAKLDADATLFYWALDAKQQAAVAPMCAKHGVRF